MAHLFRLPHLVAFLVALSAPAFAADDDTAARDKKRMDLISGISCSYYTNSGTIRIEYNAGGTLMATVKNIVGPGSWYVENDRFCLRLPPRGDLQCDDLRRTAIQTKAEAITYLSTLANSKCYD